MVSSLDEHRSNNLKHKKLSKDDIVRINCQLEKFVDQVSPSQETMDTIYNVYEHLREMIESSNTIKNRLGGQVQLMIYGSVVNGLFAVQSKNADRILNSDLDITVIYDTQPDHDRNLLITELEVLKIIRKKIKAAMNKQDASSRIKISKIQKPYQMSAGAILKIQCSSKMEAKDDEFVIDVDLSVNKHLEILNSNLIFQYCLLDQRFRKVALVLKQWNRCLTHDKQLRLNSFSIQLLLLAYMLEKKFMINLQTSAKEKQFAMTKVHVDKFTQIQIASEVQFLRDEAQINHIYDQEEVKKQIRNKNQTSGELLVNFLKFYRYEYRKKYHIIDLCQQKDKYFYADFQQDQVFSQEYCLRHKSTDYEFIICDPFTNSCNTARVKASTRHYTSYDIYFEKALQTLLENNQFIV